MKPVSPVLIENPLKLEEVVIAKDQPQYLPLPAIVTSDGVVTSRWSLTWRERWRVLVGGSLWVQLWAFGRPLQPIALSTTPPAFTVTEGVEWPRR